MMMTAIGPSTPEPPKSSQGPALPACLLDFHHPSAFLLHSSLFLCILKFLSWEQDNVPDA